METPVDTFDAVPKVLVEETNEPKVGTLVGQCKWFNDNLGFGFLTIQNGNEKGKDIFVHHSGIKPLNSNYKTLTKGEYVNFDVVEGPNGQQAVNVTGIFGGSLMCDITPFAKGQHIYATPRQQQTHQHTPGAPVRVRQHVVPRGQVVPRQLFRTQTPPVFGNWVGDRQSA
jgi:CspA family cold shock protein